MPDRGKLVVATILAVALGLAIFAWYWRWQQGHRAAEFWGAETSQLIRAAPQAELLILQPQEKQESSSGELDVAPTLDGSQFSIEGKNYLAVAKLNLTNSPGLIHARHSLTEDVSFAWNHPEADCQPEWTHAMRLSEDGREAVLAFDFNCRLILLVEQGKVVAVVPRIAEGFQRIFERAIASQNPKAPRPSRSLRS